MSKISGIPVVDFSAMGLRNKDPLSENSDDIKRLADQVYHAFSRSGFVYLKNHGIPQEMVSTLKEYFSLKNYSSSICDCILKAYNPHKVSEFREKFK